MSSPRRKPRSLSCSSRLKRQARLLLRRCSKGHERYASRRLHGLPNVCPRQKGPLCEGKPRLGTLVSRKDNDWWFEWVHGGEVVAYPWRGFEYHIPMGKCIACPSVTLRRYEVVVEGNEGRLYSREDTSAFLVVREEDPGDRLVRFEKTDGFPAREGAENMARAYDRRLYSHDSGRPSFQLPSGALVSAAPAHSLPFECFANMIRKG